MQPQQVVQQDIQQLDPQQAYAQTAYPQQVPLPEASKLPPDHPFMQFLASIQNGIQGKFNDIENGAKGLLAPNGQQG